MESCFQRWKETHDRYQKRSVIELHYSKMRSRTFLDTTRLYRWVDGLLSTVVLTTTKVIDDNVKPSIDILTKHRETSNSVFAD